MEYINGVNQFGNIIVDSDRVTPQESSDSSGSSDFSIAEVTVVNNAATNIDIIAPFSTQYGSTGSQGVRKDTTGTYEVIVLNNSALLYFSTFGVEVSLSVTGSIELDGDDCLITGDGTITIS